MIDLIGQSVGRYHILEQLGEGGMATVYKAFDTRLEREVALKIILPTRQQSPRFLKRFEREAKALAQLSHPNIVKIHDYGEHEGLPYLVMEYTQAGTLKARLGEAMASLEAAALLAPIARALEYAHSQKIVHRDVKPSNILITRSGEPMLSDFGIAKVLETEETWDLTGTGVGIGTPEYMAPEQGMGKPVDYRADIYALGIVLYELVTGRKPFRADTPLAVLMKQVNDPLPQPRDFVRDLPKDVERVIFKSLAKSPYDRFQDMGDFAQILENLVHGDKAVIGKTFKAFVEGMRRPRLMVTLGMLALTVLIAVGRAITDGKGWLFSSRAETAPVVAQASGTDEIVQVTATLAPATEAPTRTTMLTATRIPPGTLLLEEDFEDGRVPWFFEYWGGGNWEIVDDETGNMVYEINNMNGSRFPAIVFGSPTWRDYAVEFRFRVLDIAPQSGVVTTHFRLTSNSYSVNIHPYWNEMTLAYLTNRGTDYLQLAKRDIGYVGGGWHSVRVEARGTEVRAYFDNALIFDLAILEEETGRASLVAGPDTYAQFDDIRVIALGEND